MKILKSGTTKQTRGLTGECQHCSCIVECAPDEAHELIDQDTQPGMATRWVKCPECHRDHLWVS